MTFITNETSVFAVISTRNLRMKVTIFSRPIHSGKTSALLEWCAKQPKGSVAGILAPDVDGRRQFRDIASAEQWPVQLLADCEKAAAASSEHGLLTVGRYFFSGSAFRRASDALVTAAGAKPSWLIIDEVGKLELLEQGFASALQAILAAEVQPANLLLAVREGLVDEVIAAFNLRKFDIAVCTEMPP